MTTTEPSVDDCLKELREMGFARIRLEYAQIFDSEFPHSTRIWISAWRSQQGGRAVYASTLSEAMSRVRAWHREQAKE
jgi:hypothetical protein